MRYITEKFEFIPDEHSQDMLLKNCEYAHFLHNKCVERILETKQDGKIIFSRSNLKKYIQETYEFSSNNRPPYLYDYEYYFTGISAGVVKNIGTICSLIKFNRKHGKSSDINFKAFDYNHQSFSFENKVDRSAPKNKNGLYRGNKVILTENPYIIALKINRYYSKQKYYLGLTLRENIFDRMCKDAWGLNDIREIRITFHNDKWFIHFVVEFHERFKIVKDNRKDFCGIDLGETNPVVIYDDTGIVSIPDDLKYPRDSIIKKYKRLSALQSVLDHKEQGSNNYKKVLAKIHKCWDAIVNIKHDWHNKLAIWIVSSYRNIVVDEFKNHINHKNENYIQSKRKRCNFSMFNKGMSHFIKTLRHMSDKYNCNYYTPVLETTDRCSRCGNINNIKLVINEEKRDDIFKCELCSYAVDRDNNAACNCYKDFLENRELQLLDYESQTLVRIYQR